MINVGIQVQVVDFDKDRGFPRNCKKTVRFMISRGTFAGSNFQKKNDKL
jgi:hypothetical protein